MLVATAAERWKVPVSACDAENGQVVHHASGRKVRYGALATEAAKRTPPDHVTLKTRDQFQLLGHPIKRIDGPDIVTGRAGYGIDVRVPGMVFASIERAHRAGRSAQRSSTTRRGARDAGRRRGRARARRHSRTALRSSRPARGRRFEHGRSSRSNGTWARIATSTPRRSRPVRSASSRMRRSGSPRERRSSGACLRREAARGDVHVSVPGARAARGDGLHGRRGPTAREFWAPTQTQRRCMQQATKVTGLPEDKIRIHATLMGGGFGRRLYADYLAEAGTISKAVSRPVQGGVDARRRHAPRLLPAVQRPSG